MKCCLVKKGDKYYVVINEKDYVTKKWHKKWITTGTDSKKEAEKKLVEIENQLNNGTYINPEKITFEEFLNDWLSQYVKINCEKSTYAGYEVVIKKHVIPFLGKIPLQKLSPLDIQKYYTHLLEKGRCDGKGGVSPNTVKRHHANIHKALDYALKMQLVLRNIADAVEIPKPKKFESGCYEREDVVKILEECKGTRMEIAINLALGLGLRRSEICGLRWSDVDFENNLIKVRQAKVRCKQEDIIKDPKSESSRRTLKAEKPLMEILKSEKLNQKKQKLQFGESYNDGELVFRNVDGTLISPATLSHQFSNFIEKHGLTKIRLHDLRHTNITHMLKNKVSYKVVQKRAGHSDIQTTLNIYGHVLEEMEEEAVQNIIYQCGE